MLHLVEKTKSFLFPFSNKRECLMCFEHDQKQYQIKAQPRYEYIQLNSKDLILKYIKLITSCFSLQRSVVP